jgi:pSer/pThr/pTyr-binding forkhead associated (FHA) protein
MLPELMEGTFLWYWGDSWAPLHGMILAIMAGVLSVFVTKWTHRRNWIKLLIATGVLATVPLGVAKLGFEVPYYEHHTLTYFNFFGTVLALVFALPYLFHQTLRAASGKYSKYMGHTISGMSPFNPSDDNFSTFVSRQGAEFVNPGGPESTVTFQSGPRTGDTMRVGQGTLTVGRAPDNDIVIDDPTVSRNHARITVNGGQFTVEDLNSTSGTHVDGRRAEHFAVMPGSVMKVGNSEFVLNSSQLPHKNSGHKFAPASGFDNGATQNIKQSSSSFHWLVGTSGGVIGESFKLDPGITIVGRDTTNHLVVDDHYVSRQHAMVKVDDSETYIFDLGSIGGTKVNGKDIGGGELTLNSVVRIGDTELTLLQVDNPNQFVGQVKGTDTLIDNRGQKVPALIVTSGMDGSKSFILNEGDNVIGRGPASRIDLSDDSVSRRHALVRCQNGKMTLLDLGSKTGTLLNGRKLGGYHLNDGDVITMGRSEFTIRTP